MYSRHIIIKTRNILFKQYAISVKITLCGVKSCLAAPAVPPPFLPFLCDVSSVGIPGKKTLTRN